MLIEMYIFMLAVAFVMFILGGFNLFKLQKESRTLIMVITTILFLGMTLASFDVQYRNCEQLATSQSCVQCCETDTVIDISMVLINVMFLLLSLILAVGSYWEWWM